MTETERQIVKDYIRAMARLKENCKQHARELQSPVRLVVNNGKTNFNSWGIETV